MSPCRKCRENISCGDGTELCRKCQAENIFAEMFDERLKGIIAEVESAYKLEIDSQLQKICSQLQKAEEVIRFYADEKNWNFGKDGFQVEYPDSMEDFCETYIGDDRGQKAREYLEGKK